MIFLYQVGDCIMIHEKTFRELRSEFPALELLRQFHKIQDALAFLSEYKGCVMNFVKKTFMGIPEASRETMRERKRGENNPNHHGLSDDHRRKISATMRKHRKTYPEHHGMLHRNHTMRSRRKISLGMRRIPKRRWCVDASGKEHLVDATMTLPPYWVWGRVRHHV
jgi:hypothetical protein